MMKKLVAVFVSLALMVSTAGCVAISFSGKTGIRGKGEIITVDIPCGDFSEIVIKTSVQLYYTAEKSSAVKLELYENLVPYLTVSSDNGILVIDSERSIDFSSHSETPRVYVSAPTLERLCIKGAARISEADRITADSFVLEVDGVFGGGGLDLDVRELTVDASGVGNTTLTGTADKAFVTMSGVGNLNAFGLQTREAEVKTSGVGSVEISCSGKLDATVSGVGGISYIGDPDASSRESGVGRVTKAG